MIGLNKEKALESTGNWLNRVVNDPAIDLIGISMEYGTTEFPPRTYNGMQTLTIRIYDPSCVGSEALERT